MAGRGSIGAAARELGIAQPAATLMLRELEGALGATLVARDRRGARLTAAGQRALARLEIALASVDRAVEAARAGADAPSLRLGTIQAAGVDVLPDAIARLERAGFQNGLRLTEGRAHDLVAALVEGRLDCVVGWIDESLAAHLPMDSLALEPLLEGRMQVFASKGDPLARSRAASMADLARRGWIVPPPGSRTHAAFARLFVANGLAPPTIAVECASLHTTFHVVAATRMLAVAPDSAVRVYARRGMVAALRGPGLELPRERVSVITRRDSDSLETVRRLRQALLASRAG